MKIIILSPNIKSFFSEIQIARLKSFGELHLIDNVVPLGDVSELYIDGEKIIAIDPDFCDWKVSNEVLDNIPGLKAVCLQTTSFSWVDVEYLAKKGIPVTNLRGFSSYAVAEWAVLMALNLARKVPLVIKGGWKCDYEAHLGLELKGSVAGVIGLGSIGTRIAEICNGLGMEVVYWSKSTEDARFKKTSLSDLMASADFIFPAVAQNEETKGLITDPMILSMKKRSIFVSIVHEVYNHKLLLDRVASSDIFGYGFEEGVSGNFDDYTGNVWAGPELAWVTKGSLERNSKQWLKSIEDAVSGNYPTKVI